MTETEQLADIIALSVHAAMQPLLMKIAVLEARVAADSSRDVTAPFVDAVSDLRARVGGLEARAPVPGPPGVQGEPGRAGAEGPIGPAGKDGLAGKDADLSVIGSLSADLATVRADLLSVKSNLPHQQQVEQWVQKSFEAVPTPRDGKDGASVSVDDLAPVIASEVRKAVAALSLPVNGRDGTSVTLDDVRPLIASAVAELPKPKDGADGKSVSLDDVRPLIEAEIAKIPTPRDGKDGESVTADDVAPLIAESVAKAFQAMPVPKDGRGIKSTVINHAGRLLVTMSDDVVQDLGPVVGSPGVPGRDGLSVIGTPGHDGTSVTVADVRPLVAAEVKQAVAEIPPAKNGVDGLNGKDAFGFDDLDVAFDDRLGWQLLFARGDEQKSFPLPIPYDAGIWEVGRVYPKGAGVTVKGAFWIALRQTSSRPGGDDVGARDWRLAVKGGKDGKAGKDGRNGTDA